MTAYIIAGPDAIYGVGETIEQAIEDAQEWAEFDAEDIVSHRERRFANEGLYYQECTDRLADWVREHGTPSVWDENEDGMADLEAPEALKRAVQLHGIQDEKV